MTNPTETQVLVPVVANVPLSIVEEVLNAQFGANVVSSLTGEQMMAAMTAYVSPLASVPPEIATHVNRQYILSELEDVAIPVVDREQVELSYPEQYSELPPIEADE